VNISGPQMTISTYPNPVSTTLNINISGTTGESLSFNLINMNGITMHHEILPGEGGWHEQLDMYKYPAGMYFIRVISDKNELIASQAIIKD